MNPDILRNIKRPIFFVTNDISRAIGLEGLLPNYHIVCLDDHYLVDYLLEAGVSVFCLERQLGKKNTLLRNSGTILSHPLALSFIKEKSRGQTPNILFFKPQKKLDLLAREYGFNLVGNSTEINRLFEDKVAFYKLCQQKGIKIPEGEIASLPALDFDRLSRKYGTPLVIQFGRGWAGNSTYFITQAEELRVLRMKFGQVKVRVTRFISGKTILNNAVVYGSNVFFSKPALQIKADACLTSCPGATGGRQWPVALDEKQERQVEEITRQVGGLMKEGGYKGFFGLDFLVEDATGEVYLSENNARLTASTSFYTKLELGEDCFPLLGYHLLSFLPAPPPGNYASPAVSGSEIIIRNNLDYPVEVVKSFLAGFYDQKLRFRQKAYSLQNAARADLLIVTVAEGRVVNPEIELAKINTLESVCDKDGRLNTKYLDLVLAIKKKIVLEKC